MGVGWGGTASQDAAEPTYSRLLNAHLRGGSESHGVPARGHPLQADAKKSLRWYIDNVPRVETFLLGANPGLLNTSANVSDITSNVYTCCNGLPISQDGVLKFNPIAPWNATLFAAKDVAMYATLALASNCSASGTPAGCLSTHGWPEFLGGAPRDKPHGACWCAP